MIFKRKNTLQSQNRFIILVQIFILSMSRLTIEELIKTAKELNSRDEFRQIIELIPLKTVTEHKTAELSDELAKAFVARADERLGQNDSQLAKNDLDRAIKLNPKNR